MHDCCDLYLRLLDDMDLLFSQYSGSDSYVRKQSTTRNPVDTVKCALNAISSAIRLSRRNYRGLSSQLVETYIGIRDTLGSGTRDLLQQMRAYSLLDCLYSALWGLTPLISGKRNDLFDGASYLYKSRIVKHLEEAVSYIASAARDIQNGMYHNPKETEGDEKYYRHASRAVFACVGALLEGCVPSDVVSGRPLSFSGIKATIRLVLLLGDATPRDYLDTAAQLSIMQFEHCIEQLAQARGVEQWAPDNEHQIALSAFKFAVNAYADSRGTSPHLQQENSALQKRFTNFHLLEATSYVDYITIKSGAYAYVLDAYEEEHKDQQEIYDCSGEICDLEGTLDAIDALVDSMLQESNDGSSGSFYSSPAVRSAIKRIADNVAVLLAKICTWAEAWHALHKGGASQPAGTRATALYDVLQKSREDFMVSVGRALELFTICVCRLDDVHYSRNVFPLVAAWDSSSLPVFPGEYTRPVVSSAPQVATGGKIAATASVVSSGQTLVMNDGEDASSKFSHAENGASGFGSHRFAEILDSLNNFFKKEESLSHGRRALGRSVPDGEAASSSDIQGLRDVDTYWRSRYGNNGAGAARAHRKEEQAVLSKAFLEVVGSGTMQECLVELRKVLEEGKQQRRTQRRAVPSGGAPTSNNYLTVPESSRRHKRVASSCCATVDLSGRFFSSAQCPAIVVTESTETAPAVVSDLQAPSTCLEVPSSSDSCAASLTRGV